MGAVSQRFNFNFTIPIARGTHPDNYYFDTIWYSLSFYYLTGHPSHINCIGSISIYVRDPKIQINVPENYGFDTDNDIFIILQAILPTLRVNINCIGNITIHVCDSEIQINAQENYGFDTDTDFLCYFTYPCDKSTFKRHGECHCLFQGPGKLHFMRISRRFQLITCHPLPSPPYYMLRLHLNGIESDTIHLSDFVNYGLDTNICSFRQFLYAVLSQHTGFVLGSQVTCVPSLM